MQQRNDSTRNRHEQTETGNCQNKQNLAYKQKLAKKQTLANKQKLTNE